VRDVLRLSICTDGNCRIIGLFSRVFWFFFNTCMILCRVFNSNKLLTYLFTYYFPSHRDYISTRKILSNVGIGNLVTHDWRCQQLERRRSQRLFDFVSLLNDDLQGYTGWPHKQLPVVPKYKLSTSTPAYLQSLLVPQVTSRPLRSSHAPRLAFL